MKLFKRTVKEEIKEEPDNSEIKSSTISPFVAQILSGSAGGGFLSPSAAMSIWEYSDSVYSAVDLIANPFSQMTYSLKDKKTGEYLSNTGDHPILDLLANPGFMQSGDEVMYGLMASFLVTGGCYPIASGNVKYDPTELKFKYPNKLSLVPNKQNELYRIMCSDGQAEVYDRQLIPKRNIAVYQNSNKLSETIQIRKSLMKNGVYPSSPLSRAIYQAKTKNNGLIHNNSLLKNGTHPGGLWAPDSPLGQDAFESFRSNIRDNFSGPGNAGRNIIAPRPIKYEPFGLTPQDMDFINLIDSSAKDIYNIYHIPLALISTETMTMSNFENSQTALYDMAVLPNAYLILKALGDFLLPRYKDGDRFELTFDEKTLPALRSRMLETAKTMREVYSYSEDEIRASTGHEPVECGEEIYRPATLTSNSEEDYVDDFAEEETEPDD